MFLTDVLWLLVSKQEIISKHQTKDNAYNISLKLLELSVDFYFWIPLLEKVFALLHFYKLGHTTSCCFKFFLFLLCIWTAFNLAANWEI